MLASHSLLPPSRRRPLPPPQGERQIRGTGLYAAASMVNHECLPNVARFDHFDAPPPPPSSATPTAGDASSSAAAAAASEAAGANTAVHLRALHDLPPGEEVTQAYFPLLPWTLRERQQRCRHDYGFACACPRCREEATWPADDDDGIEYDDDDEQEGGRGGDHGMEEVGGSGDARAAATAAAPMGEEQQQQEGEVGAGYVNIFLLKYVCPRRACYGTLAPLAPGADVAECNMCGARRSEAEFLAELEAAE